MPTQELHQEREQRSFQEVQQYFMKNFFPNQGGQFPGQGVPHDGRHMRQGQDGGRPGGYQQRGPRPDGRPDRKFNNQRGGGGRYNARPQGGSREGYQQQPAQVPPQGATPDQSQMQHMVGQPGQYPITADVYRIQQLDPAERRQEIGNSIYQVIHANYGEAAGKITGMLLDNERIVDPIRLVSDFQYLQQKALEAWTLLNQQ